MVNEVPAAEAPELLALDWGTTHLRAFLMRGGHVLRERQSDAGIQKLPGEGAARFEQALRELAGDWLQAWPGLPVIACGMVGSVQGWLEAPYAATPADPQSLGAQCVRVQAGTVTVHIVPGVLHRPEAGAPDVMRGEETQVAGALLAHPAWAEGACFVLPGTHSKWVVVRGGRIRSLRTFMTGELYAVLRAHSILGRLMPADEGRPSPQRQEAFEAGIAAARQPQGGGLLHQLFAARTLGLAGGWPHGLLADYLSGLLVGAEVYGALQAANEADEGLPLVLVGAPDLCARYQHALSLLGHAVAATVENTAPRGLWSVAQALKWVPAPVNDKEAA